MRRGASPSLAASTIGPGKPLRPASARWTHTLLALSFMALVGSALWGLLSNYRNMMEREGKGAANLADGMQVYVSEILKQSLFSAEGIAADLRRADGASPDARLAALRGAMRYDPASAVLGIAGARGTLMIDKAGKRLDLPALQTTLERELADSVNRQLTVLPIIYAKELGGWYLPVQLALNPEDRDREVVFALVPTSKLVQATASIRLVPQAYVTFVTPDGLRLLQFFVDTQEIKANKGMISATSLAYLRDGTVHSFQSTSTMTGEQTLFGISRSQNFPLAVGVGIQVKMLKSAWLMRNAHAILMILLTSLSGIYFSFRMMASRRKERAYLRHQEYLANHDTLTDLPNRHAFQLRLDKSINAAEPAALAVVLLGLNRFKEINDTLGHLAGDHALKQVALRLRQGFGTEPSFVARLGGDEMAVCTPLGDGKADIDGLCRCIAEALALDIIVDGIALELDASLGVAVFPDDAGSPSELLRCADIAMYAAKHNMRQHERYTQTLNSFTADRLAMKSDLSHALREGGLTLVYQPKIDLRTGALAGVEALSRWHHPVKGAISPAEFIPVAESSELIHAFTRHVLQEVFRQSRRWLDAGYSVPVSANISTNNLMDATFVEMIGGLLAAHAVPPEMIELEVTESALMRNPDTALRRLAELRALGLKLSIDDFGSGYASLSYLKQLPTNCLKIDNSFILNLVSDAADKRIVRSTIDLAHSFGMTVVAEGVETQEIADLLRNKGCDIAQGYHFSRPLPARELEVRWLAHAIDAAAMR
ncbi:bifunctional diguanylate cyclase/phosphodiesterase [Oxalobacteraceae bacterium]|nr:bifunctional diguanylate cyclase/phosphodiesterase [Oxalobacteraceae bacterium]